MSLLDILLGVLAVAVAGMQIFLHSRFRFSEENTTQQYEAKIRGLVIAGWTLAIGGVLSILGAWTYIQYSSWLGDGLGRLLLPPHRGIGYFALYAGTRFFAVWVTALLTSILLLFVAKRLNIRFENKFFRPYEPEIMALGAFLSGYPGVLLYVIVSLIIGVLGSWMYRLRDRGRFPMYFVWLPTAVFVILVVSLLPDIIVASFKVG